MNNWYAVVSGMVFGLIAVLQLFRVVNQVPIQVGSVGIPVSASWVAVVVAGSLCAWAFVSRR